MKTIGNYHKKTACKALAASLLALCSLTAAASTLTRADRLSPLAAGYLERAKIMIADGNYAGVIDQLKHLETQGVSLQPREREACAYYLALALYQRGDADCVDLLRKFAEEYPASPQAIPAQLAAADYFFFASHYNNALAAYRDIDFSRINPAEKDLYTYREALCLIKCGQYDEAKAQLDLIETSQRFHTPALYYKGYIDYAQGRYDTARKIMEQTAMSLPAGTEEGIAPEYYLAQIDYAQGNYQNAAFSGAKLLKTDSEPELATDTRRIVGLSYFKLGEYDAARKYLADYIRAADTPAADAVYALGVIDYSDGDLDAAQRAFQSLTGLNNDLAQSAYLYLGQIAVRQDDSNAAAISFENASKMNFDSKVTEAALFNYIAARTHGGNIPFSSSIPMLTGFLSQFPHSKYAPQVQQYLALAYFNEKDYLRALESVNRIAHPSKDVLAAKQKILYELGMESATGGQWRQAEKYLEEAVALGYDQALKAQSLIWLGDAQYQLGKFREAESSYRAYLNADRRGENRTLAKYDLAYALLMQDRYAQSADAFADALKSEPLLPQRLYDDALIRMADAQYYSGNYRIALKNYTTAIENGATDSDYATFRRAVMFGLQGDIDKKLEELSALPKRFPNSKWLADALLEKGQTYTALGQNQQALSAFEQLRSSNRHSAQARKGILSLAIGYMKQGDTGKAIEAYREIIEKWPTSEEAALANDDLRRYHSANGGLHEYAAFLKGINGAPQINASEMEALAFEGAETAFAQNVTNVGPLERYVAEYPSGANVAQAWLDIATGYDEKGETGRALAALDNLLSSRPDAPQVPEALLLKAQMLEDCSRTKEAAETYRLLETRGSADYAAEAAAGLMRNAEKESDRLRYARIVKNSSGLSAAQLEEAEFYEATALLAGNNPKEGVEALRNLAAYPKSITGAKAAVTLGEYLLENGDVNGADKVLTAFTDEGSPHEYWLARGFIALADVCHERGKDYLAVEYLKSLRDNYPGKELDIHDMISTRLKKWK